MSGNLFYNILYYKKMQSEYDCKEQFKVVLRARLFQLFQMLKNEQDEEVRNDIQQQIQAINFNLSV